MGSQPDDAEFLRRNLGRSWACWKSVRSKPKRFSLSGGAKIVKLLPELGDVKLLV
jgi:hypothetical protein